MTHFPGTGIFWITLVAAAATLSLATFIGRAWGDVFPCRLKGITRFYLAPVLGLASMTIIASLVGRVLPLGNSIVVPLLIIGLLVWAIVRERQIIEAFHHVFIVSIFGVACGASILGPLFVFGGFNAHNDAFTYLVHANWLQNHAFNDLISAARVTPLTTQVSLYQEAGLRMGASFLLALMQALLNLQWSYEVYPALAIAAIASCCLAIGFPLAQSLRPLRRVSRLALLALPAFSFGGLVFGANLGFLPQTIGLALGAGLLFMIGPVFHWLAKASISRVKILKAALPGVALLVGATFAYSEIVPFLLVAVFGSGFVLALRYHTWGRVLAYMGILLGLTILLLNLELLRAYSAIVKQSGAVVGSPVDWSLLGYAAHAFGVHGGAWDIFQWTTPENAGSLSYILGLVLICMVTSAVTMGYRIAWRTTISGALMPAITVLIAFSIAILYFRYFVLTPFPKGTGQSWSQFKLADWAHPFVSALVLLAFVNLKKYALRLFTKGLIIVFTTGLLGALLVGVTRTAPLMNYYNGVTDLNQFYLDFRNKVFSSCPLSAPIFLELGGQHHKFRQMAALYLYDRQLSSDWTDDGYIFARLPIERRLQTLKSNDCVVEPIGKDGWLTQGIEIGPYRVGIFDGQGQVKIVSAIGGYDRESDGKNWWYWVERKVYFKLQPLFISKEATQFKLHFEYGSRNNQKIVVTVIKRDGSSLSFVLQGMVGQQASFDKVIEVHPSELAEIGVEADGKASRLGPDDDRLASMIIRNLSVIPTLP